MFPLPVWSKNLCFLDIGRASAIFQSKLYKGVLQTGETGGINSLLWIEN